MLGGKREEACPVKGYWGTWSASKGSSVFFRMVSRYMLNVKRLKRVPQEVSCGTCSTSKGSSVSHKKCLAVHAQRQKAQACPARRASRYMLNVKRLKRVPQEVSCGTCSASKGSSVSCKKGLAAHAQRLKVQACPTRSVLRYMLGIKRLKRVLQEGPRGTCSTSKGSSVSHKKCLAVHAQRLKVQACPIRRASRYMLNVKRLKRVPQEVFRGTCSASKGSSVSCRKGLAVHAQRQKAQACPSRRFSRYMLSA